MHTPSGCTNNREIAVIREMIRRLSVLALAIIPSLSFAFTPATTTILNHKLSLTSMRTSTTKLHYSYLLNDVASSIVQHLPISIVDSTTTTTFPSLLLTDMSALSSLTSSFLLGGGGEDGVFTTNNIKTAFTIATFFPQLPWLFLILLPTTNITKKLLGGYEIIIICCLIHFFIVTASILQPEGTNEINEIR